MIVEVRIIRSNGNVVHEYRFRMHPYPVGWASDGPLREIVDDSRDFSLVRYTIDPILRWLGDGPRPPGFV